MKERDLHPPLLYGISNRKLFPRLDLLHYLELLFRTSAQLIQWREKDLEGEENCSLVRRGVELAGRSGKIFLINTDFRLAWCEGSDGVHLTSRQDFPDLSVLREEFPRREPFLVGCSTHSEQEVIRAQARGADYVFLGPLYPPLSKPAAGEMLGLREFERIASAVTIPVFALGGLEASRCREVARAGAVGVAGIGWVHEELEALL